MNKELKALNRIKKDEFYTLSHYEIEDGERYPVYEKTDGLSRTECFKVVRQALLKAQEQEKENAKYKRLEQELGCPLEVLARVLLNNYFYDIYGNIIEADIGYINQEGTTGIVMSVEEWENGNYVYGESNTAIYLKDYKKTWWLKESKEE